MYDNLSSGDHSETMSLSLFTSKVSKGYRPPGDAKTSFSWDSSSLPCVYTNYPFHVIRRHFYTDLYESKVIK